MSKLYNNKAESKCERKTYTGIYITELSVAEMPVLSFADTFMLLSTVPY